MFKNCIGNIVSMRPAVTFFKTAQSSSFLNQKSMIFHNSSRACQVRFISSVKSEKALNRLTFLTENQSVFDQFVNHLMRDGKKEKYKNILAKSIPVLIQNGTLVVGVTYLLEGRISPGGSQEYHISWRFSRITLEWIC